METRYGLAYWLPGGSQIAIVAFDSRTGDLVGIEIIRPANRIYNDLVRTVPKDVVLTLDG